VRVELLLIQGCNHRIVVVDRDGPIRGPKDLEGKSLAVSGLQEIAGLSVRIGSMRAAAIPPK